MCDKRSVRAADRCQRLLASTTPTPNPSKFRDEIWRHVVVVDALKQTDDRASAGTRSLIDDGRSVELILS